MRCVFLLQDISHSRFVLTSEAEVYLTAGSPEVQLFNAVPADGVTLAQLKVRLLLMCEREIAAHV